eukprot:scaffold18734_cov115-Skeletonema_dohrnii-CCMP3373.AAC.6
METKGIKRRCGPTPAPVECCFAPMIIYRHTEARDLTEANALSKECSAKNTKSKDIIPTSPGAHPSNNLLVSSVTLIAEMERNLPNMHMYGSST